MVTHCGHGTTIKALAAGVPVVCLRMARHQFDVAARVVHRGAGVRLEPFTAPADIAAAVHEVLSVSTHAKSARDIAAAIAEETAQDLAVREIEALLSARRSSTHAG